MVHHFTMGESRGMHDCLLLVLSAWVAGVLLLLLGSVFIILANLCALVIPTARRGSPRGGYQGPCAGVAESPVAKYLEVGGEGAGSHHAHDIERELELARHFAFDTEIAIGGKVHTRSLQKLQFAKDDDFVFDLVPDLEVESKPIGNSLFGEVLQGHLEDGEGEDPAQRGFGGGNKDLELNILGDRNFDSVSQVDRIHRVADDGGPVVGEVVGFDVEFREGGDGDRSLSLPREENPLLQPYFKPFPQNLWTSKKASINKNRGFLLYSAWDFNTT